MYSLRNIFLVFVPGCIHSVRHPLRRTRVLFYLYAAMKQRDFLLLPKGLSVQVSDTTKDSQRATAGKKIF